MKKLIMLLIILIIGSLAYSQATIYDVKVVKLEDTIWIMPLCDNQFDKNITMIEFNLSLYDAFGDYVYDITYKLDFNVPAKTKEIATPESIDSKIFLTVGEINPSFNRLSDLALSQKFKFVCTISRVLFGDGTILKMEY